MNVKLCVALSLVACSACDSGAGTQPSRPSSAAPRASASAPLKASASAPKQALPAASSSAASSSASAKAAVVPGWQSGSTVSVLLRAHRLDRGEGACASPVVVGEHRCFLRGKDEAWPKGPPAYERTFIPISMVHKTAAKRQNLLAIGFWQDPVVQQRSRACVKPFLVRCNVEVWKPAPKETLLRWRKKESWFAAGLPAHTEPVYLGKVLDCKAAPAKESPLPAMYCGDS